MSEFDPQAVQDASKAYIEACNVCRTTNPNTPTLYEVDKNKIFGQTVYFYDEKTLSSELLYGKVLFLPSMLSRGTNKYRIQVGQDLTKNIYYDVEKIYTDRKELSNNVNVTVPIRSGGRKSKKVFKNKNKKRKSRKSRKSRKTSKRSRRH